MSFIKAKEHLKKFNLENKIIEFPVSSATVKKAAEALGCEEARIAKSLGFIVNERVVLVIAAGDQKIDNAKYKKEFGVKAKMIPLEDVESKIGHEVGGVCPFGINENVEVYLDISLKAYDIMYPACGSHNSAVRLTIDELEKTSRYLKWVDVCKN